MIWQIVHKCDFEKSKIPLFARSPYLEREALVTDKEVTSFYIFLKVYKEFQLKKLKMVK